MSFISTLSQVDLDRLRMVVKRVHFKHYPAHMITNYEADKLIDSLAPEIAGRLVKEAVDSGQV